MIDSRDARMRQLKLDVYARLLRLGYHPNAQPSGLFEDLRTQSAQFDYRNGALPPTIEHCMAAVQEALVLEGGIEANIGDGVSCVAQIIWAMSERIKKLEKTVDSMK